ncbi:MAG: peptidase S41, partial [Catalinimonas sp.]
EGEGKYGMDLMHRYEHGEYFHADSIKFDESMKYRTTKGRTVYGGGGIMPDVFVPADTSTRSRYLIELWNKNIIREYAMNYHERNKTTLERMKFDNYLKNFEVDDRMMVELEEMAERAGIAKNPEQFRRSKPDIRNSVKAFVAKSVWKNVGYYPVFHQQDEIFRQALEQFDRAQALEANAY